MAFIKLTLIPGHNQLEENPDGESVWVNSDHISAMSREVVGFHRILVTKVLISNILSEDGTLNVKEHPQEILKLIACPPIDTSNYVDD